MTASTDGVPAGWRICLTGRDVDLQILADLFDSGDPQVIHHQHAYWLCSADFQVDGGFSAVVLDTVLARLNGLARLLVAGFVPVSKTDRFEDHRGGVLVVSPVVIGRVVMAGANRFAFAEDAAGRASLIEQSLNDPVLARIISMSGAAGVALSWVDLWKIVERVCEAIDGNRKAIVDRGWVTADEITRFEESANHPSLSNDGARHAVRRYQPTTDGMSQRDAQATVIRIVHALAHEKTVTPIAT
jgi:hypothetical protein